MDIALRNNLCPGVGMITVNSVLKNVKKVLSNNPVRVQEYTVKKVPNICNECKSSEIVYDDHSGDDICTQCGLIVRTHQLKSESYSASSTSNPLLSTSYHFTSNLSGKGKTLHRINALVERDINRYKKPNMVTGDQFKDQQRLKVTTY